ncbi:hypothetical protein HID58_063665 [Brassica napus]|uniref:Uncharacterized protein n=1 Tax=Brassica napus TaxID=3708 RepID=A0ABQ7XF34_BRANA|nr:hypothetical protein HID58_063665 [Brassica napus]
MRAESLEFEQSLVVFDVVFPVVGLPSIVHLLSLLASLVALPFAMFANPSLDNSSYLLAGGYASADLGMF